MKEKWARLSKFVLTVCMILCGFVIASINPKITKADTIYWQDTFQRADGAVGNSWTSNNGADGQIVSNQLHRADTGAYRILYNPTGGTLPADYYVTVTIPHTTLNHSYWGIIGRYTTAGGADGSGIQIFWTTSGPTSFGVGNDATYYNNNLSVTVTGGIPASWSVDQDHTVSLQFTGTMIRIYLDGQEYGYLTDSTNNIIGTNIGITGDGIGNDFDILDVTVSDYLPTNNVNGIFSQSATPSYTTSTIAWNTTLSSSSTVEYGTTSLYGSSLSDATLTTTHSLQLTGLTENTIYHYRVVSTTSNNQTVYSDDAIFITDFSSGTLYWQDTFQRADGAVGNSWTSDNGADGQIVSNQLHRADTGSYRILYNPSGGTLPSDYYVTMTVPNTLLSSSWWGLIGRYLPSGGDGTGLKVFWTDAGSTQLGVGHASFASDITLTVTGGYPASWSQNINHIITLGFVGTTTTVYLDGQEYGYFNDSTNNQTGTGIGLVGDGISGTYNVLNVKVTDYAPGLGTDSTPPTISTIGTVSTATSANVMWSTNESATSTVEYGTTTGYGSTQTSSTPVLSHTITLPGLTTGTLYHYRITSQDASGNTTTSSDYTFTAQDEMVFETTGSAFSAILNVDVGATVAWTFGDGTTSSSTTPTANFGTQATRFNHLVVTPWSAVNIINIGYDGGDGGTANTPYLSQQNVIATYGMSVAAPYLEQWTSSNNPLTSLDFSNYTSLTTIECFNCQSITSVTLTNTPALSRLDLEDNNLSSLDVSQSPSLSDLRGAVNNYPTIVWGTTGTDVWHICIRDNPQMTSSIQNLDTQYPALQEFWVWNSNQSGPLHITSTNLTSVIAYTNHYTTADFSGDMPSGRNGTIDLHNNDLTSVNISNNPGLVSLDLHTNLLGQAAVDSVLETLNGFGTSNGTVNLSSNSVPSNTGFASVASLQARGWTVTVDTDATAPTITAFTLPSTGTSLTVPITTFTATDNSGVTGYYVSESSTTPLAGDAGWQASAPSSYTFSSSGSKTLYAWVKDYSSNISTVQSSSTTITLDVTAPVITAGNITTSNTQATISWTTNEQSSTYVEYGINTNYGNVTSEIDTSPRVTSHTVTISGILPCSTYHVKTYSKDASNNTGSGSDTTFTTTGCTASSQVISTQSAQITNSTGGTLTLEDGNSHGLILTVPASFSTSDANFQAHQLNKITTLNETSNPTGYTAVGDYVYQLSALRNATTAISTFLTPLTLKISYASTDISGIDPTTLRIWRHDGTSWNMLSNCSTDAQALTVTCTTANFSVFALFATPSVTTSSSTSITTSTSQTSVSPFCQNDPPGAKAPWLYGAIAQSSTSVLLYFTDADDPIDSYALIYGTQSGSYQYGAVNIGGKGTRTYLVQSLAPNTTYFFKVQGKNGCQPGAWSNEISTKTHPVLSLRRIPTASTLQLQTDALTTPNTCKSYTVESGDTLWSIAKNLLGDGNAYSTFATENSDTYPSLQTTNVIEKGWILKYGCNAKSGETQGITSKDEQGFIQYSVVVKVVNEKNQPVKGARISLDDTNEQFYTNEHGEVVFSEVSEGDHVVKVQNKGWESKQSVNVTGIANNIDITITVPNQDQIPLVMIIGGFVAIALLFFVYKLLRFNGKAVKR